MRAAAVLANGSTSTAPLTFYLGHSTALVTGTKREFLLSSLSPWQKDDWFTEADQLYCPKGGKAGKAHAYLRMGGHVSHYPRPLNRIPEPLFRPVQIVLFLLYIRGWERKVC